MLLTNNQQFKIKDDDIKNSLTIFEKYSSKEYLVGIFYELKYKLSRFYLNNNFNKSEIHCSYFKPKSNSIATLIICPGWLTVLGILELADYLASNQISVISFDFSGFGFSTGSRRSTNLSNWTSDLCLIIDKINSKVPIFILGHSLGSLTLLNCLILNQNLNLQGIILSSPLLQIPLNRKYSFFKKYLLNILSFLFNEIYVSTLINSTELTKNNFSIKQLSIFKNSIFEIKYIYKYCNDEFNYKWYKICSK